MSSDVPPEAVIGSPFKKHRASLPGFDDGTRKSLGLDLLGASSSKDSKATGFTSLKGDMDEDEEL